MKFLFLFESNSSINSQILVWEEVKRGNPNEGEFGQETKVEWQVLGRFTVDLKQAKVDGQWNERVGDPRDQVAED